MRIQDIIEGKKSGERTWRVSKHSRKIIRLFIKRFKNISLRSARLN